MLRQFDLCSGVGAGFPLAGVITKEFELIGLCEIDEWCRGILRRRFPGVTRLTDVKEYKWERFSSRFKFLPEVVTASPPCQPFSVQGKRRGVDDERDCFGAVTRAIAGVKPRYFAIENVCGLLNCPLRPGDEKLYFQKLLFDFHCCGYDVEWLTVSSGHFGSPWIRERLLLVGISHRLEFDTRNATPWNEQVRAAIKIDRLSDSKTGSQPGISRSSFGDSRWLDKRTGKTYRYGVGGRSADTRRRREALGNALDPNVAAIALNRILYWESLISVS
ncbi:MAG: DNA cytosine methyltransferase [Kamptonema sp. SIO1D9]|nr:DNA cytosine methyltransferase [Kamptonema sp. SIO1D9]